MFQVDYLISFTRLGVRLDKIHKEQYILIDHKILIIAVQSLHLEGLAIYHDSGKAPWNVEKRWKEMTSKEWSEVMSFK